MPQIAVNYLLFDLDGTLVNSTPAVEQIWHATVDDHNLAHPESKIDPLHFLSTAHGSRTSETFAKWFPYRSNSVESVNDFEETIVTNYGHLALEVGGTLKLLGELNSDLQKNWAVVTSGTRSLAHGWFAQLFPNFKNPEVFITANDVSQGKPNPEGYLSGFTKLNVLNGTKPETTSAVVFEDAPTGIRAGVSGGFPVIGIATTFSKEILIGAGATYVVQDMSKITLHKEGPLIIISLDTL